MYDLQCWIKYYILYTIYYLLFTIYCILYTIYSILYTIYLYYIHIFILRIRIWILIRILMWFSTSPSVFLITIVAIWHFIKLIKLWNCIQFIFMIFFSVMFWFGFGPSVVWCQGGATTAAKKARVEPVEQGWCRTPFRVQWVCAFCVRRIVACE